METVISSRKEHVEMFLESMLPYVFSSAIDFGLDITKDECVKSTALFVESLKAVLYNSCDIDHILHDFADQMFEIGLDGLEGLQLESDTEENTVDIISEWV